VILSVNRKFAQDYRNYLAALATSLRIEIAVDPETGAEKLGSLGALQYLIESRGLHDDILLVAGDTISSLDLAQLKRALEQRRRSVIGAFDVKDAAAARQLGIVQVGAAQRIIGFEEKPAAPKSTLAYTYLALTADDAARLREYLSEGGGADRLGDFVAWLIERSELYAHAYDGFYFDIGTHESLARANRHFRNEAK
jgi:glucose-1-phosphate thymidylyltransferase